MGKRKFQFEDEINFREILRHPSRWFGYAYIYLVIILLALSIIFLNHVDFIEKNATPYFEPDSSKLFIEIQPKFGSVADGVRFEDVNNHKEEILSRGEEIYKSVCSSCHGNEGKGNGLASAGLNPKPRNFTIDEGWKNGKSLTMFYKTLQEGIPGSAMVAYDYFSPKDKISLFYFISSKFFKGSNLPSEKDFAELDSVFKVSEKQIVPTQIPISLAMQKIIEEAKDKIEKRESLHKILLSYPINSLAQNYIFEPKLFSSFLVRCVDSVKTASELKSFLLANLPQNGFSTSFLKLDETQKDKVVAEIFQILRN